MKPGRWIAARWQVLSAALASAVGIGATFLPWVRAGEPAGTVRLDGLESTMAVAWFQRNLSLPASAPDVPDAVVPLVLFGLVIVGAYRSGLDQPYRVAWGWRITAGLLALVWYAFQLLVIGASKVRVVGTGPTDAEPGIALLVGAAAAVVLLAVALAAVPSSSRDATYERRGPRSTEPQYYR